MAGTWKPRLVSALVALLAVVAVACGSQGGDYGGEHPDYETALAGSPAPLAALHRQADQVLEGGAPAFEKRIASLRGYPIVVNKWASWCHPCRFEFPFFQNQAAKHGTRVAFLGVDSDDSPGNARTFLKQFPVPFPSYSDPDQKIAKLFKATLGFPSTGFYDRRGKLAFTHTGVYANEAKLAEDIERYAK